MSYYGGDPLGLNWMPMLALYSSLGNKSNTHAQNCQIGTQLQKLDGKDRIVIEGISSKIDQLIARNNVSLSGKEMQSLKDTIVKELGKIASQPGNQSSGPVVCNANSLVFDEDVKSLLSDLVREKAEGYTRNAHENEEEHIGTRYFDENLYRKNIDELRFMFRNSSSVLTVPTDGFSKQIAICSMYVKYNHPEMWSRTLTDKQIMDLIGERYPKDLEATEKNIIHGYLYERGADESLMYSDVDIIRVIHTYLIQKENMMYRNSR